MLRLAPEDRDGRVKGPEEHRDADEEAGVVVVVVLSDVVDTRLLLLKQLQEAGEEDGDAIPPSVYESRN